MITSHAHQLVVNTSMTSSAHAEPFTASAESAPHSGGPGSESPAQFEDDFDIPPIHLPPSALEEPDHNKELWEKLMSMYNDYFKTQEALFTTIRDNKHNIADHQQRHFGLQTLQRAHSFLSFKI